MVASLEPATTFSTFKRLAFEFHRLGIEVLQLDHDRRVGGGADFGRVELLVLVAELNLGRALRAGCAVAAIETSAMAANMVSFGSVREKDMLAFPIWLETVRRWHTLPEALP